jgi:amino acid adenylation domain-containing protein
MFNQQLTITPGTRQAPLSFAQERLWFFNHSESDAPVHTIATTVRFSGQLEVALLEQSLDQIIRQHDAARADIDGYMPIIDPALSVTLAVEDLRTLPPPERSALAQRRIAEETRRPFDASRRPLLRTALLRMDAAEYIFVVAMHQLVAEDWSLRGFIQELTTRYDERAAEATAAQPELPLLLPDEWNATAQDFPRDRCLHELFEAQARRTPDAVALLFDDACLTYAELNRRANQLAWHLRTLGVGPEVFVGLHVERSLAMVIGMLGILKAGGAYVPLDPTYPHERLAFIIEDSQVAVLLTATGLATRSQADKQLATLPLAGSPGLPVAQTVDLAADWPLIARGCPHDHCSAATATNLAYLIYTSGSTGRPKGVAISHQSAVALCSWARSVFTPEQLAGVLATTSICFDLSVFELFVPLSWGGMVILAENALQLPSLRAASAVTLINTVPSAITELERLAGIPSGARTINLAGEPLPQRLAQQLYAHDTIRQVFNLYGPSEDTTYSTAAPVSREHAPNIGRPIANTQVYLLDSRMQLVAIGTPGEVYIGGAGLARGYLNRPDLTAERFVPNPFSDCRLQIADCRLGQSASDGRWLVADGRVPQSASDGRWLVADGRVPPSAICNLQSAIGTRLYRTGDLARYLPDGSIDFLGRIDHQVKIRGFRIELREIEAVLAQHAAVREAVVLAREDVPGDKRLVAYVVPTTEDHRGTLDRAPSTDEGADPSAVLHPSSCIPDLRAFLAERLPAYMVPAAVVLLETLPLTPNGKVDRKALPAPVVARSELSADFVAPRTPVEAAVAQLWADVLHTEQISVHDNFFELGGHSLLATQVIARVRSLFQLELAMRDLFEAPTIAELAAWIATRRADDAPRSIPAIRPVARDAELVPSFSQQRLWFFEQLDPGTPTYNIALAIHLTGALHEVALEQSLDEIVRRHEALRTTFAASDGQPVQVILPHQRVALPVIDIQHLPPPKRAAATQRLMSAEARAPFDLTRGPLIRATLLRLGADAQILLLTMHHIVSDGWSLDVLFGELSALYTAYAAGSSAALPELAIQYADFAQWQREWLRGEVIDAQLAYWRAQLGGQLPLLDLPTDRPRPALQTFRGAQQTSTWPADTVATLESFSRRAGVTLFMTLMAAFKIMLHRYTGQTDLLVGTPIANRTHVETERLIGFFVNTLVLRSDLAGRPTAHQLLAQVRDVALAAYAHQDLPFEQLVEALHPERDLSYNPIFQVMFVLQNMPAAVVELPGLTWRREDLYNGTAKFDLWFSIEQRPAGLMAVLEYNTDLFDATTIIRMLGHFQGILAGIAAEPQLPIAGLPLLTAAEQRQLLVEWNDTALGYPQASSFPQMFAAQVARTPDASALVFEGQHLTYRALDQRANQLARHLRERGVGPEVRVGIRVERSVEMVVGLLGILKAGGAYLPLDPAYPQDRLAYMLDDARVRVLLTVAQDEGPKAQGAGRMHPAVVPLSSFVGQVVDLRADWPAIARQPGAPIAASLRAESLAYVIYTSGSTGRPKGVQIPHRALVNLLGSMRVQPGMTARDALLAVTTLSFDIAALELFLPLTVGARVVIASREIATDGARLGATLARCGITVMQATPTTWQLLLAAGWPGDAGLRILCGGEALPRELADRLRSMSASVWNVYGPTETTIWSAATPVAPGSGPLAIGRPIANTTIYLLDSRMAPVPLGVAGEVYIGGAGLARGYLGRPDLTAERFVPNPFATLEDERRNPNDEPAARPVERPSSCVRLYRTGDLARYRPDGQIVYLGRTDQQVKLRGYRIELGEIATALGQHPAVRASAVLVREDTPGHQRLVAYVVPAADKRRTTNDEAASSSSAPRPSSLITELRAFLGERLPEYMLPSAFVLLDTLPLTPNGKLDRRALPAPDSARLDLDAGFVAPSTPTEELLAQIWADVLHLERVGRHEHFFALGGHSLLATQLIARIRDAFQLDLSVRTVFEAASVAEMAERITQARQATQPGQGPVLRAVTRAEHLPLSFAQQRLWFLDQLNPASTAYIIPSAIRLSGSLDVAALQLSIDELVRRHEALRTTFAMVNGRPVQQIAPARPLPQRSEAGAAARSHAQADSPCPMLDLSALPEATREELARQRTRAEVHQPFDLARGPLLRTALLRLTQTEHVLLVTIHHIVFDDWSLRIFLRELATLYESYAAARPAPLPELPIQYADFAIWQRAWLQGAEETDQPSPLQTQLAYWQRQLAGAPAVLELPADRPRPAVQTFYGAEYAFELPAALGPALKTLSRQTGVTLFMTLLAAFQVLLSRYTGQTNIVVGSPVAGRTRTELEDVVGCFVNMLALHTDLSGNPTFRELLGRVREVALGAYAHQELPFERLVEALRIERDLSRTPLFQVLFDMQTAPATDLEAGDLTIRYREIESTSAKFDLSLVMWERAGALAGVVLYNTDLFDASTVARMLGHFQTLLVEVAERPQQSIATLPLLPAAERADLLVERNRTEADYPRQASLPALFEAQVARTPNAIAAVFGDQHLSYRELNARVNQLAHYLRTRGVAPGVPVGICLPRSLDLLVGLLGILKAGGAFVPLDPSFPAARMEYILADAQVQVLLVATQGAGRGTQDEEGGLQVVLHRSSFVGRVVDLVADWPLIAGAPTGNPRTTIGGADLAYIIYTSGSTGRPKGVMIPHMGIVNYLVWCAEAYGAAGGRGAPVHASVAADAIFPSLFAPLLVGTSVVIFPEDRALDVLRHALVAQGGFSFAKITPSQLEVLNQQLPPTDASGWIGTLVVGAEAVRSEVLSYWQTHAPAMPLLNEYGPTETVVGCSIYPVPSGARFRGAAPIGLPIANLRFYVLDAQMQPVPIGVPGELYIGGDGVAWGYRNRPALTAERFVPDPFADEGRRTIDEGLASSFGVGPSSGARLYKTGDIVRYLPDPTANIEFLGRTDDQVKVRGYRVELGEIEAVLDQHPLVREVVVLAREDATPAGGAPNTRLVAYVVPRNDADRDPSTVVRPASFISELRAWLQSRLPEYMLPSAYVLLDAIPLAPHGKIDRHALPAPDSSRPDLDEAFVAPRTPAEATLAQIWSEVLGIAQVGVYDNFFALGGHSLLATQVMVRIRESFQVDISLRALFDAPNVAGLTQLIVHDQLALADDDELAFLLAEMEQLSDSDALAVLS